MICLPPPPFCINQEIALAQSLSPPFVTVEPLLSFLLPSIDISLFGLSEIVIEPLFIPQSQSQSELRFECRSVGTIVGYFRKKYLRTVHLGCGDTVWEWLKCLTN